jgi:glutamate-5-semialdehyde dehydrogenase
MTEQTSLNLVSMGQAVKQAAKHLARATTAQKDRALLAIADALAAHSQTILTANALDLHDGQVAGLSPALLDRLSLKGRLEAIAADVRSVAGLPDPVGQTFDSTTLPNGLRLAKQRMPLGVLGVVYEARPNVTIDIAILAIKTGNGVILRGGKETIRTNLALLAALHSALNETGLPPEAIQLIADPDRRYVSELLRLHDYVDLIIPRGGAALHKLCRENSTIPVITGGVGICHLFVDASANLEAALPVIHNAKTQRPSVCNTLDTVLVHHEVAAQFVPRLVGYLSGAGVSFRLDAAAMALVGAAAHCQLANDAEDWDTEWMSLVLGIKIVPDLGAAIDHIEAHSQAHSDGILTADAANAARFVNEVTSAAVYVNASTRFTDGGQFGLGAEVAVSTQKLHARGPMGLQELTTYKWVAHGDYHIRQ